MANAADIASRTGIAQQAPVVTSRSKEKDAERPFTLLEDTEEGGQSSPSLATPEKKIARRTTKKRHKLQTRQKQLREAEAQRQSSDIESAKKSNLEEQKKTRASLPRAIGMRRAQNLLEQQSLLNQASLKFEQSRGQQEGPQTPLGRQQAMLDSLIRMTDMLYHQHTSDKAGEAYNRPETRKILTALKGLKGGNPAPSNSSEGAVAPRRTRKEIHAQLARIEKVQQSLMPIALPADYEPLDLVA